MGLSKQLRRRSYSGPPRETVSGLSNDEAHHLRLAFVHIIEGLSDRQLLFAREEMVRFFENGCPLLDLSADEIVLPEPASAIETVTLFRGLCGRLKALGGRAPRTPLDQRIAWLTRTLGLGRTETTILGIFARHALFDTWRSLIEIIPARSSNLSPALLALMTGLSSVVIEECLRPSAPLVQIGLIDDDGDGEFSAGRFLLRVARLHTVSPKALIKRVMPPAQASSLEWADYSHLGPQRDLAQAVLASGAGVSILLHGAPGTGKTEFARLLADRMGRSAVFAGLADERGHEPSRGERIAHLGVLRSLTRADAASVIVVDEADDILRMGAGPRSERLGSKQWLNRLVEMPGTPTIWIANDPAMLGDTVVRRMTLAIGFDLPPATVRARVLQRAAEKAGVTLTPQDIATVAAQPAAPAVLTNAVAAAQLSGGGGETVLQAARGILTALGVRTPAIAMSPHIYDASLAYADRDLQTLALQLAASPRRGWSMLLSGASGTGKSAFARHLAERVGIEVIEKRGSDLLSPFVGGTEENIAAAFSQAGERGAMLLIDEADSFLFDRQRARHSWETSMVNEMLRWMDWLKAPFVATTNLAAGLDLATQRRFMLRVTFHALTPERSAALFVRYFDQPVPENSPTLENLTPGDFGVVSARASLLDMQDPRILAQWLISEAEARGGGSRSVGFDPPVLKSQLRDAI